MENIYALLTSNKRELELRVMDDEKVADKFEEFIREEDKTLDMYLEIESSKKPETIINEFREYGLKKGKNDEIYSIKKEDYSLSVYPNENPYKIKERILDYFIENKE